MNFYVVSISSEILVFWLYYLVFMVIHSEAELIYYTHLIPILNRLVALIIIICSIIASIKKS